MIAEHVFTGPHLTPSLILNSRGGRMRAEEAFAQRKGIEVLY